MITTRDELRELISAPLIKDRYAPDHVRHYADLQLDGLSAAGYAVVPRIATEDMCRAMASITAMQHFEQLSAAEAEAAFGEPVDSSLVLLQAAYDGIITAIAEGNLLTKTGE